MLLTTALTFRRIDPQADADLVVAAHRATCIASFGEEDVWEGRDSYLKHLKGRVEEFPDGHVLAFLNQACVGQLELQAPYGLTRGYVNLFYVAPRYRRLGFGRMMHGFAERYFRSWEAEEIDLHVSPVNRPAVLFYQSLGYQFARHDDAGRRLRLMSRRV